MDLWDEGGLLGKPLPGHCCDIFIAEEHRPAPGFHEGAYTPEQGCLAAPVGPDKPEDIPG